MSRGNQEDAEAEGQLRRTWRTYGLLGVVRLTRDLLLTRLMYPGSRIVRYPCTVRGRRHVRLGRELTVGIGLRLDAFGTADAGILITIGDNVEINDHVHIAAIKRIVIGNDVLIASRVFISDHNHGDLDGDTLTNGPAVPPAKRPLNARPVVIGARVWIGEAALILPGITIGEGSIIGGGAVVTHDVPAGCVVAGNPARMLRRFDPVTGRWQKVLTA